MRAVPQRNTINLRVGLDPARRMDLHFHLEASDGMATLEDSGDPEVGLLEVAPEWLDTCLCWLRASAAELGLRWVEAADGTILYRAAP